MMLKKYLYLFLLLLFTSAGCEKERNNALPTPPAGSADNITITSDKAVYHPRGMVVFTLDKAAGASARVRYRHLGNEVAVAPVSGTTWQWQAPASDFAGYMVELYEEVNGTEKVLATIGVDVSSDWSKFPRYGFLSKFPQMEEQAVKGVIANLNRHHINGIQFYDWHYKHHKPLPGTAADPTPVYKDIINRDIHLATVRQYITAAHARNMKAMHYNLIFGALKDAASDGVAEEWYLYTDNRHSNKDRHPLPSPPFISDIFLLNPANTGWQQYLLKENRKVYNALPFDGFHMDQLGNRNTTLYTYNGTVVDLPRTYKPFIEAMKADAPQKAHVMNAVNQYGQEGIAHAPTNFLYTEVWDPNNSFSDLAKVITDNNQYSNNTKNTVLAAYMNYDLANNKGFFNTPSVLLADAVIFAFGGSHLELGEHMLGKEYFPNDNLQMKDDLKKALVNYYDFLVGYQNLLRDGGTFNSPALSSSGQLTLNNWPPRQGQVSVVGKEVGNRQVIHLLNFTNATTMEWRDNNGTQAYPQDIQSASLTFSSNRQVKKLWYASPDVDKGAAKTLEFTQNGNQVSFTLPLLRYWDMVVVEY